MAVLKIARICVSGFHCKRIERERESIECAIHSYIVHSYLDVNMEFVIWLTEMLGAR